MLAWGLWALTLLSLPVVNWLDQRLRQAGLPELAILEPGAFPLAAAALTAATVGAVLASRRPQHPMGGCCSRLDCRSSSPTWPPTTCTTG